MYTKYLAKERGQDVMYVKLKKSLYGTLQAALLLWNDLTGTLTNMGFVVNPYDWCVANKMINGKQCTIVWHVDDLKVSHVDADVLEDIVTELDKSYGKQKPLVVTRGKVHDYLGMTLDFVTPGKVIVKMQDYNEEMLDELPPEFSGVATTPAADHLFRVNPDAEKLSTELSDLFHHFTTKLLYLSKRARPDVQTTTTFFTTRAQAPDVDDYKKLNRIMAYLRGTIGLVLTLEADDLHIIKWWVDTSFAVHPDMKSHTSATMSMGKGSIYATSV
jgi:hypothetical protein